jgi:hypothetical protein
MFQIMEFVWNPLGKPKKGSEAEFLRLFKLMRSLRAIDREAINRSALDKRWEQIQVTPYETLNTPRVGTDEAADMWAVARYRAWTDPTQTESEFLQEMKGFYVLQLLPKCDGLPWYSNGGIGDTELFSFRAQLLRTCEEVIGRTTMERCYKSCLAPALEELGEDLQALATQYADKMGVTHVESSPRSNFDEGGAAQKAHIVLCAAKWCKYWSHRDHGLAAYWPSDLA